MVVITFMPLGKKFEVKPKANLIASIINARFPIGSSCGALGVCGKCFVQVLEGEKNLSPPTPLETKLLIREQLPPHTRIACQTKVLGDITITTSYW